MNLFGVNGKLFEYFLYTLDDYSSDITFHQTALKHPVIKSSYNDRMFASLCSGTPVSFAFIFMKRLKQNG